MNKIMERFNFEGVLQILVEKYGKKFMLENMDLFYLWYSVERKMVNENRDDMINYLKGNNIIEDTRRILSTISRYFKFKEHLPSVSNKAQSRLDRGNQYLNPLVPFQKVGNKMLGIIDDNNKESKSVIDISEGREDTVAVIFNKGGVSWRNDNLHPGEMRWVVDYVKNKNNKINTI